MYLNTISLLTTAVQPSQLLLLARTFMSELLFLSAVSSRLLVCPYIHLFLRARILLRICYLAGQRVRLPIDGPYCHKIFAFFGYRLVTSRVYYAHFSPSTVPTVSR